MNEQTILNIKENPAYSKQLDQMLMDFQIEQFLNDGKNEVLQANNRR